MPVFSLRANNYTLRNASGIEWSCEDCLKNMSRRSSFMIPEDEGEEDYEVRASGNAIEIETRKLVQDISCEVKKAFKEEMISLETALELLSELRVPRKNILNTPV